MRTNGNNRGTKILWGIGIAIWILALALLLVGIFGLPSFVKIPSKPAATLMPEETPVPETREERLSREPQEFFDAFASKPEVWSLYFRDLESGITAGYREQEPMVSASLIKLFVMAAVYDAVEQGEIPMEGLPGLLEPMITVSSNEDCNRLIDILGYGDEAAGLERVNRYAEEHGYTATRANRKMLEDNGLQNYVSAYDCAGLLESIYRGTCVSEKASKEMMNYLLAQTSTDRIPALLPEGVEVAHKTGEYWGLSYGDVGIVLVEERAYLLCCICNEPQNGNESIADMAQLSRSVFLSYMG